MIDQWLSVLSEIIKNSFWLAPIFAILAGVLTSFSPCSLSSLPLIIGYVGGYAENDTKKAFRYSLVFSLGISITLTGLGIAASLMGRFIGGAGRIWYIGLGVLMVLMALHMWEIITLFPRTCSVKTGKTKGYLGALIAGILGGVAASPCATPVLIVLLTMVAQEGNVVWGGVLLLLYSLGYSVLMMIAGTSVGFVKEISQTKKYEKAYQIAKILLGTGILAIALYLFYLGF